MQIAEPSAARDGFVEHRSPAHLFDILPEIADGELLRDRDLPVIRGLLADDHPEQRRLASAVGTDEADLFPGLICNEASTKRICLPYCLPTFEKAITSHYDALAHAHPRTRRSAPRRTAREETRASLVIESASLRPPKVRSHEAGTTESLYDGSDAPRRP